MDIEEYAKNVHFHVDEPPALLMRILKTYSWQSYLDLGCGDGWLLSSLKNRGFFQGKRVAAVDLSESRIQVVRGLDSNFECHVSSAESIPMIQDASIDLLVSSQVIEHVPSQENMLKEMHRVLIPGGLAYLSTVHKKWYGWYFYRCNGKWALDPTHLREYRSDDELLGPISVAGLKVIEARKELFWFPLSDFILRRLLPANAARGLYRKRWLQALRRIRVPIPGYYNWELVLQRSLENKSMLDCAP